LFNESVFPFTKINCSHQSINPESLTSSLSQPHFFYHTYFDSINQNSQPNNTQPNNTQTIPLSPTSSTDYPTSTPSSLSFPTHLTPLFSPLHQIHHFVVLLAHTLALLTLLTMSAMLVPVIISLLQHPPTNLLQRYLILFVTLLTILVFHLLIFIFS